LALRYSSAAVAMGHNALTRAIRHAKPAHRLPDVTVVADAGMISEAKPQPRK
jgi:hypothetical protein